MKNKVELRNQVFEHVSRFSMGTLNYELDGAFRETQYVPIFPAFYKSQGFSEESLCQVKLYLGSLK